MSIITKKTKDFEDYTFDSSKIKDEIVKWIRDFFEKNGSTCNAIVGISGGKDSSIVAALCVEALGKDRVIGILLPCGLQNDINVAYDLVKHLDIKHHVLNIETAMTSMLWGFVDFCEPSVQTKTNLPARLRMTALYMFSQSLNGRVANTCNLSEDWVGYATRYGDGAGDFSPLSHLTVEEVKLIGRELNLPEEFIEKVPIDGLCGKTDEDNLGFSYAVLDNYIRTGFCDNEEVKKKIDSMHEKNLFKLQLMPSYDPCISTQA